MSSDNDGKSLEIVLECFRYQAKNNPLYRDYIQHLGKNPSKVQRFEDIPFLPIQFFKHHVIQSGTWTPQDVFTSSGTTGSATSRHYVKDLNAYLWHSKRCFEAFFGDLQQYHLLALLPSYLERTGSSLLAMIDAFIKWTGSPASGYYLHDLDKLIADAQRLKNDNRKVLIWGVSFALLDLAERSPDLAHCLIVETGGMKGRRREITRQELHARLKATLGVAQVFSEYGMTELFSQAYTQGEMAFTPPSSMIVLGRSLYDPFEIGLLQETSGINIIDLANSATISFIETEDLGRVYPDGRFEVLGRMDNSDIRGCNLLLG